MVIPPFHNPEYVENLDENVELFFNPDASFRLCEHSGQYFTNAQSNDAVIYHANRKNRLHLGVHGASSDTQANSLQPAALSISSCNASINALDGFYVCAHDDMHRFLHMSSTSSNVRLRFVTTSDAHVGPQMFVENTDDEQQHMFLENDHGNILMRNGACNIIAMTTDGIDLHSLTNRIVFKSKSNQDDEIIQDVQFVIEGTHSNASRLNFERNGHHRASIMVPYDADSMQVRLGESDSNVVFFWGSTSNESVLPFFAQNISANDVSVRNRVTSSNDLISLSNIIAPYGYFKHMHIDELASSNIDVKNVVNVPEINVGQTLVIGSNAVLKIYGVLDHDGQAKFNKDVEFQQSSRMGKDLYVGQDIFSGRNIALSNDLHVNSNAVVLGNINFDRKATFCNDGITFTKDVLFDKEFNILRLATFTDNVLMKKDLQVQRNIRQEFGKHTQLANLDVMDEATFEHMTVRGRFDIQSQLVLNAQAVFQQGFRVENTDVVLDQGLEVQNDAGFCNNIYVRHDMTVWGDVGMQEKAHFCNHGIVFKKDSVFERDLDIIGTTTFSNDVTMNQDVVVLGNIEQAQSKETILGNLDVINDTTLQNLVVTGNFTVQNGLDLDSLTLFRQGIRVKNDAADIDTLLVRNTSRFDDDMKLEQNAYIEGNVNVAGVTFTSNLEVFQNAIVNSNMDIMQNTTIHSNLAVENDAHVKKDIVVDETLYTKIIDVSQDATVRGHVDVLQEMRLSEGESNAPSYTWMNDSSTGLYLPDVHHMGLVTHNEERVRIDDRGYVGINVIHPEYLLDVRGNITARAPFLAEDGGAEYPTYSFKNDNSTGMYLDSLNHLAFTASGVYRGSFDTEGLDVNGAIRGNDVFLAEKGDESNPVYTFKGDKHTGMFLQDSNQLAFGTSGTMRGVFDTQGVDVYGDVRASRVFLAEKGNSETPVYSFKNDADTGIFLSASNTLAFSTEGGYRGAFDVDGLDVEGNMRVGSHILAEKGTVERPIYTFKEDEHTGIYLEESNVLGFATNGTYRGSFTDDGFNIEGDMRVQSVFRSINGMASAPTYTFENDDQTGMYLEGINDLGFTANGVYRGSFDVDGLNIHGNLRTDDQVFLENGASNKPIYSFKNDRDTGMYRKEQDTVAFSTDGTYRGSFDTLGLDVGGFIRASDQILAEDGENGNPIYTFKSDKTTGMYYKDDYTLAFSTEGGYRGSFRNEGMHINGKLLVNEEFHGKDGAASNPIYTFESDSKTGMYLENQDQLAFATNNGYRGSFCNNGFFVNGIIHPSGQFLAEEGASSSPIYSFDTDRHTGMYHKDMNVLGFATNHFYRASFDDNGLDINGNLRINDRIFNRVGSVEKPAYTFSEDTNSGIYQGNASEIAFCTDQTYRGRFDNRGFDVQGVIRASDQFLAEDGDAQVPIYTFKSDSNTGMYLRNLAEIAFSISGSKRLHIDSYGIEIDGDVRVKDVIEVSNGTESHPAYSFLNHSNTGMYMNEGDLTFTIESHDKIIMDDLGMRILAKTRTQDVILNIDGSVENPAYAFNTNSNTGILLSNDDLVFARNNVFVGGFSNDGLYVANHLFVNDSLYGRNGASHAPTFSFEKNRGTGMFLMEDSNLAFTRDAQRVGFFDSIGLELTGRLKLGDQSLAVLGNEVFPSYSFGQNSNAGMYMTDFTDIAISVESTLCAKFHKHGLRIFGNVEIDDQAHADEGSATHPSYSFTINSNTGVFLQQSNDLAFAHNSTLMAYIDNAGLRLLGDLRAEAQMKGITGSGSNPTFSFTQKTDTGMFLDIQRNLAFAHDGVALGYMNSNEMVIHGDIQMSNLIANEQILGIDGDVFWPSFAFRNNKNTGFFLHQHNDIGFVRDGTHIASIHGSGIDVYGKIELERLFVLDQIKNTDGHMHSPAYSFCNSMNTGMYLRESNDIGFVHRGSHVMSVREDKLHVMKDIQVDDQIKASDKDEESPAYSFASNSNSGMILHNQNDVAFIHNNVIMGIFDVDGLEVRGSTRVNDQVKGMTGDKDDPSFSFQLQSQTGMFLQNYSNIGFTIDGEHLVTMNGEGMTSHSNMKADIQFLGEPKHGPNRPAYSFENNTGTGMYLSDKASIAFTHAGTRITEVHGSGTTTHGTITAKDQVLAFKGDVNAPSYSFSNNVNTGMYIDVDSNICFTRNGALISRIQQDGVFITGRTQADSLKLVELAFDDLVFSRNSNQVGRFNQDGLKINSNIYFDRQILATHGNQTTPSYSFENKGKTGMYLNSNSDITFTRQEIDKAFLSDEKMRVLCHLQVTDSIQGRDTAQSNAPAYSFLNHTDTGMYLNQSDDLVFSRRATDAIYIEESGVHMTGSLKTNDFIQTSPGSAEAPSFSFQAKNNTGIYLLNNTDMAFTHSGSYMGEIDSNGLHIAADISAQHQVSAMHGYSNRPSFSFNDKTDTGMYLKNNQDITFTHNGQNIAEIKPVGLYVDGKMWASDQIRGMNGNQTRPSFAFENNSNTGFFLSNQENIAFTREGNTVLLLDKNGMDVTGVLTASGQIKGIDGNESNAAFAFTKSTNTGLFLRGDSNLGFTQNGRHAGTFDVNGLQVWGDVRASERIIGAHGDTIKPTYTFTGNEKIGMYLRNSNDIAFARNDTRIADFDDEGLELIGGVRASDQIKSFAGSLNAPTFSFIDRDSTGMFLMNSNDIGFSYQGQMIAKLSDEGMKLQGDIDMTGVITANNGTANTPAYNYSSNTSTGTYLVNGNDLSFSHNGTQIGVFDRKGLGVFGNMRASDQIMTFDGSAHSPSFSFNDNSNTGVFLHQQNNLGIAQNDALRALFDAQGMRIWGNVRASDQVTSSYGSPNAPTYSFTSNTDVGMYLHDGVNLSFSQENTDVMRFLTNTVVVYRQIESRDQILGYKGSKDEPSFSFASNDNTGMFLRNDNDISFSINGTIVSSIDSNGIIVQGGIRTEDQIKSINGSAGNPSFTFKNDMSTGMFLHSGSNLAFTRNNSLSAVFNESGLVLMGNLEMRNQILAIDGQSTGPAYSFKSNSDTGLYLKQGNKIAFVIDGTDDVVMDESGVEIEGDLRVKDQTRGFNGSIGSPTFSFINNPDTGIYLRSNNDVAFSRNSNLLASFDGEGLEIWGNIRTADQIKSIDGGLDAPAFSFRSLPRTGMYLTDTDAIAFSSNNDFKARFDDVGLYVDGNVRTLDHIISIDGETEYPAYAFTSSSNTGIYLRNGTDIAFSQSNEERAVFHSDGMDLDGAINAQDQIRCFDGASNDPSFTFISKPSTGMYLTRNEDISFTHDKNQIVLIDTNGMKVNGNFRAYDQIKTIDGGTNKPSYTFNSNDDTGIYLRSGSNIAFTQDNTYKAMFDDGGLDVVGNIRAGDQIKGFDGNVNNPAFSFTNTPSTGMYLSSTKNICFSSNNTKIACIDSDGITVSGDIYGDDVFVDYIEVDDGSSNAPTYTFSNNTRTGMYLDGNDLTLTRNGTNRAKFGSEELHVFYDIVADGTIKGKKGGSTSPSFQFRDTDNFVYGFYMNTNDNIVFTMRNTDTVWLSSDELKMNGDIICEQFFGDDGSESSPTFAFSNSKNTGMYMDDSQNDIKLMFTCGGNDIAYIGKNDGFKCEKDVEVIGILKNSDGSISDPSITFNSNTDTGLYLENDNNLGITREGTGIAIFDGTGLSMSGNIRTTEQIRSFNGAESNPAFSFTSATTTGMYLSGADNLCFTRNNNTIALIESSGINVLGDIKGSNVYGQNIEVNDGSDNTPSYTFCNDTSTGLYLTRNNNESTINFSCGSIRKAYVSQTDGIKSDNDAHIETANQFKGPDKSKDSPTYSFTGNRNSGMYSDGNGNIKFSRTGNDVANLTSNGFNVTGHITSSSNIEADDDVIAKSDRRLKHDIRPLANATEKIRALEGVSYKRNKDNADCIGFIAQDVLPILPEVVNKNEQTGMFGINYGVITALLVQGFKELLSKTTADKAVQT